MDELKNLVVTTSTIDLSSLSSLYIGHVYFSGLNYLVTRVLGKLQIGDISSCGCKMENE